MSPHEEMNAVSRLMNGHPHSASERDRLMSPEKGGRCGDDLDPSPSPESRVFLCLKDHAGRFTIVL